MHLLLVNSLQSVLIYRTQAPWLVVRALKKNHVLIRGGGQLLTTADKGGAVVQTRPNMGTVPNSNNIYSTLPNISGPKPTTWLDHDIIRFSTGETKAYNREETD